MVNRVKKMARISGAISGMSKQLLGKNISRAISQGASKNITASADAYASPNPIPGYAKGGKVRKTGLAKVHKGELVLTAAMTKKLHKLLMK
jgi:hypothetical protein